MSVSNINIHVDNEVKSRAQDVIASLGLDMTTAILASKYFKALYFANSCV